MSWTRFKFNCRFIANRLPQSGNRQSVLSELETGKDNLLVQGQELADSQKVLYDKLLSQPNDEILVRSASMYSQLDIQDSIISPQLKKKYQNHQSYLVVLFLLFVIIGSIFSYYLVPSFEKLYDEFSFFQHAQLSNVKYVFFTGIVVLGGLFLVMFMLNSFLKKLDKSFIVESPNKFYQLLLPKLNQHLRHLRDLVLAPLNESQNKVSASIHWIESKGLNAGKELNNAIAEQKRIIETHIEKRITVLTGVVFASVVAFVFLMLKSIYQIIFTLGNLV